MPSDRAALAAAPVTISIGATAGTNWNPIPSDPTEYTITVGDALSFEYSDNHNVWLMPSREAFDNCDFSAARELASATYGGVAPADADTLGFANVYETRVDADFVHLCGVDDAAGLSAAGLTFEAAAGASQVVCGEEYVDFQEKVRPSSGWMHDADVGKDWLSVKRLTRSASEACLAQHAVEVLAGVWARK